MRVDGVTVVPPRYMHRKHWLEKIINDNQYYIGAELGLLYGETYMHLLKNCPDLKLIGVDAGMDDREWRAVEATTTEELLSFPPGEHHIELVKFAKEFNKIFSDSPRAFIRRNFTRHAAKEFRNQFLDFVFIDASHDYDSVLEDIKIWAPKVRKGGLISGHDINDPAVKKAVDEVFKNYKIGPDNIWYLYSK